MSDVVVLHTTEHHARRDVELSHIVTPDGVVTYPARDTELGVALLKYAYQAHTESEQ